MASVSCIEALDAESLVGGNLSSVHRFRQSRPFVWSISTDALAMTMYIVWGPGTGDRGLTSWDFDRGAALGRVVESWCSSCSEVIGHQP